MRRVLIVQPSLQPPGGGNGVAAWIVQALADIDAVTVLSWRPIDLDSINRFFGTSLRPGQFETLLVPRSWRAVPDHLPVPAALLRSSLLMRYTRRVSHRFDVLIGVHNEIDYGRRGIQYVHYPTYLRPRPDVDVRWYHRAAPMLDAYYRVADRLAGFSVDRMKANVTLANSDWTRARIEQALGLQARTVYPPVVAPGSGLPWDRRQSAFLALGRISPEKNYASIINILARVRAAVPNLTLTIVGTSARHQRRYYTGLRQLAERSGEWVSFRHDLSRSEIGTLMAEYRYGIHAMREEHFGMAPAEMARAGMIVWVPNGGGQVEIVGREPVLLFDSEEEAAARIAHVLATPSEQQRLREHLATRSDSFSTERFVAQIVEIVREFRE